MSKIRVVPNSHDFDNEQAQIVAVSAQPDTSTTETRETLNTWVVLALIVILVVVLFVIELHIRKLEHFSLSQWLIQPVYLRSPGDRCVAQLLLWPVPYTGLGMSFVPGEVT